MWLKRYDVTSIALFGISIKTKHSRNPYFIDANKAKVVTSRFLVLIAGRLHRPERRYRRFFDKRQSLKALTHEIEGIFVDFFVR